MSTFQARVLYDFKAQPGTGELTVTEGEILTVLRQNVGEGWWEGRNASGDTGLFPEAYVEVCFISLEVLGLDLGFPRWFTLYSDIQAF